MVERLLPAKIAQIVRLLVTQPRTVREVSEFTDMGRVAVRRYLNAFAEEGLVEKRAMNSSPTEYIYTWKGAIQSYSL